MMMAMRNVMGMMTMMMCLVSAGVVRRTFFSFFQPAEQQPEQRPWSPESVSTLLCIISKPHHGAGRYNLGGGRTLFRVIRHKPSFCPITEGDLCWLSLLVAADAGNPTSRVSCKVPVIQRFILTIVEVNKYLSSRITLSLMQVVLLFAHFIAGTCG